MEGAASASICAPSRISQASLGSRASGRAPTLQEMVALKLSNQQEVQYPVHAFGRGGIGSFLSTGSARAGMAKLPHSPHAHGAWGSPPPTTTSRALSAGSVANQCSRPWTCNTTGLTMTTCSVSAVGSLGFPSHNAVRYAWGNLGTSPGPSAAGKPWEQVVQHPHDFQAATRMTRVADVPKASRWAAISYYENSPAEIRRHIDITNQIDQIHATGCAADLQMAAARQQNWAAKQRAVFRRQRQEAALRYEAAGLRLSSNQVHALSASTELVIDDQDRQEMQASSQHAQTSNCNTSIQTAGFERVSLPKPTFVKVYDRMANEAKHAPRNMAETWRKARDEAHAQKQKEAQEAEVAELDMFDSVLGSNN